MTDYKQGQRKKAFERDNYLCVVCGKPANQCAHVIPRYIYFLKKYGEKIIDSYHNLKSACSLECNKKIELKIKGGDSELKQYNKIKEAISFEVKQ